MPNALDRITNVVVLMLENGSFDRMLGFLQSDDYPIAGLTGTETVPMDPADPHSPRVPVTTGVPYRGSFDVIRSFAACGCPPIFGSATRSSSPRTPKAAARSSSACNRSPVASASSSAR